MTVLPIVAAYPEILLLFLQARRGGLRLLGLLLIVLVIVAIVYLVKNMGKKG